MSFGSGISWSSTQHRQGFWQRINCSQMKLPFSCRRMLRWWTTGHSSRSSWSPVPCIGSHGPTLTAMMSSKSWYVGLVSFWLETMSIKVSALQRHFVKSLQIFSFSSWWVLTPFQARSAVWAIMKCLSLASTSYPQMTTRCSLYFNPCVFSVSRVVFPTSC